MGGVFAVVSRRGRVQRLGLATGPPWGSFTYQRSRLDGHRRATGRGRVRGGSPPDDGARWAVTVARATPRRTRAAGRGSVRSARKRGSAPLGTPPLVHQAETPITAGQGHLRR